MRIRTSLIALAGALVLGTTFAAGLKQQPANGVKLSGTWKLDAKNSDDPAEVLERAARQEREQLDRAMEERRRPRGTGDPLDDDDDGWGGRRPDARTPNSPYTRREPFPDRTYRRDSDGTVLDPTGQESRIRWRAGRTGSALQNNILLLQLDPNPGVLTILDSAKHVSVSEDKLETQCTAGGTEPLADAFGDGERRCGWSGRAWVIETTRTRRFKRTDRFELAKDGKTILYTSSATGPNMPAIKVSRIYTRVP